jgi:hypothetical protein
MKISMNREFIQIINYDIDGPVLFKNKQTDVESRYEPLRVPPYEAITV